jgi:gamma-glutamylcyclotransferase (GGCT)/AIG2-like uncharacterized protein YtfP
MSSCRPEGAGKRVGTANPGHLNSDDPQSKERLTRKGERRTLRRGVNSEAPYRLHYGYPGATPDPVSLWGYLAESLAVT